MKYFKTSYLNLGEVNVFNFDAQECKVEYKKLTPHNEKFRLIIVDLQTRALVHNEELTVYEGENINHHTWFNFAKHLITNDVLVQFYKYGSIVYNKKFTVHEIDNINVLSNYLFNQDHFMGTLLEIYDRETYTKNDLDIKVEQGDVVVDIGANTGVFVTQALERGASKIYVCEPNPACIKIIKNYFEDNNRIDIHELAICDRDENVEILLGYDMSTSAHSKLSIAERLRDENDKKFYGLCESRTVTGKRFKTFVEENNISHIDFLKIDTEGSEVFITVDENIEFFKYKVKKVALEFHNEEHKHILKSYFENIGYKVVANDSLMMYCLNNYGS